MDPGLRRGSILAVVALVVFAAVGGGLVVASLPRDAPASSTRVAARAKAAARSLDAVDGSQKAFGVMSGVTTYLGALGAFGPEVPAELHRFAAGTESVRSSTSRDQQVDALAAMVSQLPGLQRSLRAANAGPSPAAAAAYRPLPSPVLSRLRDGPVEMEPAPYTAALDELQVRVTSGGDSARAARAQLLDVTAPSGTSASWGLAVLGAALVLVALTTGPLLIAMMRRHQRLEREASTDALTGTANRRRLDEDMVRGNGAPVAALMIDIDHFKQMNDRAGHAAGDDALRRVADAVQACLREGDTLYRYGGEEFCALLPGATRDDATAIAERVRTAVEAVRVPGEDALPDGRLTVSVGVSDAPHAEDAIRAADRALYQAKANGRNQVVAE